MVSQSEFNQIKADLSGNDPLVKRVKLSDIHLDDDSIKHNHIEIEGSRVPVSSKFFNRLGQMVNINAGLITKMNKNSDKEIETKLLQAVKSYSETRDGDKEFLLIGDSANHQVTNIAKADKYNRLSNDTLFATAETILNEIPDMHVESIDTGGPGGLAINMIHGSQVGYEKIGKDEVFRFGISLVNGQTVSRVEDFFWRLACANGAVARNMDTAFQFGQGQDAFRELLEQMQGWAKNGFVPKTFQARLERAMTTKASYAEMERALYSVTGAIQETDMDLKFQLARTAEAQFFPEFDATTKRIYRNGFNPLQLTDAQKKFIKTDATVWDVVNELTWIGSHDTVFNLKNHKGFKVAGGNLFAKSWDLEHAGLATI
jgi:hypothetical protein